jgi:Ala-tRNA(Pro) deacylase
MAGASGVALKKRVETMNETPDADGRIASALERYLRERGVEFRAVEHAPTLTSEASAQARGEPLSIGGKALLLKVDDVFALFVLSAAAKLDNSAIRKHFGARKARFATREELWDMTGLVPGCVPPFGEPVLPFSLYADPSILEQPRIAFNAGSLTRSFVLAIDDWVAAASPQRLRFSDSGG